jgi:hypothetical protein
VVEIALTRRLRLWGRRDGGRRDAARQCRCAALPQLDDLGERQLQSALELEQDAERRVDLTALDGAHVVAMQAGAEAQLLLGEAATSS